MDLKVPSILPLLTTHPWRYHQIIDARASTPRLEHFPAEIPLEAKNILFYFSPGHLKGKTTYQLRMELPPEAIDKLYQTFSKMKSTSFWGGNINRHIMEKDGMPTTHFFTSKAPENDTSRLSFPADYEIMVLDPLIPKSKKAENHNWLDSDSHGVAISRKRNDIVYWAESW